MRRQEQYEFANFGLIRTDRMRYAPLDTVSVTLECRDPAFSGCEIEVRDGLGRPYFSTVVTTIDGLAQCSFTVGGAAGLHVIRTFPDAGRGFHAQRMGSFVVEAVTAASAPGSGLEGFLPWLDDSLKASLDPARYGGRRVWGDKCADNSPANLAYPRFRLNTTVYFDRAEILKGHLDLLYQHQKPDGSLYDHIYGDDHPGWGGERMIRSMMADLEIGGIINVHQVWMATGDTEWMAGLLGPMQRGWKYATTSPDLWSAEHGLIKRPHTADEWDVQTGDSSCFRNENSRYVIATCDAVRLPRAGDRLAEMLRAVGREAEAEELTTFAAAARERANALLWDGTKYRHHVHLDGLGHEDFDEAEQLAMSNTWACSDGLASHAQALGVMDEYERRLKVTGDRYPWWTLQPGYPEGWYEQYPPGMYCNGGLFPWVGGELCRSQFLHGRPERGFAMLREFWQQVQSDGGVCPTWYTLDGRAAANTGWTTNWDAWGIAAWGQAAIEGALGVRPTAPGFASCVCAPPWHAANVPSARVCVALPASLGYFTYAYEASAGGLDLTFTGSGETVTFVLPTTEQITLNGQAVPAGALREVEEGQVEVAVPIVGIGHLQLRWQ